MLAGENETRLRDSIFDFFNVTIALLDMASESKSPEKLNIRSKIVREIADRKQEIENFLNFIEKESLVQSNLRVVNRSL